MKKLVRLASSGVGLAAEAIEDRKKRKSAASSPLRPAEEQLPESPDTSQHHDDESDSDSSSIEADDDVWELDEALDPPSYEESQSLAISHPHLKDEKGEKGHSGEDRELETKENEKKKPDIPSLVKRLVAKCPPPPAMTAGGTLPCPVVLPQRRPGAKGRGFVRAYAPVLTQAGIDQDTFLGFLNGWDEASKASTWINVVFLTAGAVGFYPDPIVMAVTIAVQVVAGTARELQIRQRSNNYLDEINEQLFKPRGLFALVMCFDPSSARKIENRHVSLADTVAKYDKNPTHASSSIAGLSGEARLEEGKPGSTSSFSMDSVKNSLKSIRVQSGTTHGELEMPEAAALIFPEVDKAVADMGDQVIAEGKGEEEMAARIKNKFKHASEFVASYTDKRSQAEYNMKYPSSTLAQTAPKPNFASRLADPAHPANSGSLLALLSGGHISPLKRKRERRAARRERKTERRAAKGKAPRRVRERDGTGRRIRQKRGIVSRVLKKDILYLLVVNMPTEKEMAEARTAIEAAKHS